ncbi:serine/threonine protein kinase [Nannocystis exedens]|uniref:Serine/threonine protein kinase n=1 Tax=Nannocystis exedens TaxID=54 RepID=A0A1I2FZI7_9BACT|nr:serine/threonine-protein kinase [Nannocystis exedens]PCC74605.1 serine/threonine protein kinase [Nannocystis exedens]SFF10825.1 serine/threonine protein kinase [Nannocystis exedens]
MPLEAQQDALVGTVLEGRFQVERLLGEGGMGRVYVADELRLRRRCALKVLLPELTEDKDCVERFLREAQAIAQIHHEHVVNIYHLGEDVNSGVVFFAMELLVGKDLETRLLERGRKPLSWQQVTIWMEQVASAMSAVHAAGMIHRDLKPSNVFLTAKRGGGEQVKLLDFGIAKTANHAALTSTGAALGTPFYMSPEQILAQALDSRTDIYSLGVLFFEALAGRMPFIGEPIQVAMQHCNVPPPTIRAVNPESGVPAELDAFIQRMLAKDRDARPQTMEEIEGFLHDLLAAHSAGPRPSTGPLPIAAPVSGGLHDSAPNHFGPDSTLTASASGAPAASTPAAKTVLAGSTPATGLPRVDTRTNLDNPRPPASTVEIHLDAGDAARPAGRNKLLVPVLAGAAALVLLLAFVFSGGDDPPADAGVPVAAPPPAKAAPVQPVQPPTPPVKPPDPPAQPRVEPVPTDSPGATGEPVPSDTAGEPKVEDSKGKKNPVVKTGDKTGDKPQDPMAKLRRAADGCRKTHKAVKGPKITVDYATGSDGSVTRAVPSQQDALGKCLADAVKATKFAPQLKLGLKIDL